MSNRTRALLLAMGLAALSFGTHALRRTAQRHHEETQRYEDVYYVPPEEWLPIFSMGYDAALADLLWLRALIYFGDEIVHRGQVRHVFDYANAILTLDPDFRPVYRWAGAAGMYRPQETPLDEMYEAVELLRRGARRFPEDGEMAWDLGASLAFELVPRIDDPEEKQRIRAEGVEFMQKAARLGAGPDWLVLTNATQLRRLGQTEQAIRHLEEMYPLVHDPTTKREIELQIAALRGEAHAEALRRADEELQEAHRREFPYMPVDLYLLVGPRDSDEPVVDADLGL